MTKHSIPLLTIAVLALACGKSDKGAPAGEGGELMVFAAASLTDAFEAIAADFEKAHPKVGVKFNFAGSQSLRTQIENGANPGVFASANEQHMQALADKKLVGAPVVFAHNRLVIAVPASNPAGLTSLADLPSAGRIVLAGENVPAGTYARQVLESANAEHGADFAERVRAKVVSRETHVRQTLQKVALGEADAAIVYATDAASAGDKVKVIDIPEAHNVTAAYPIATVGGSKNGQLFVDYLRSEAGRARLVEFGFSAPAR